MAEVKIGLKLGEIIATLEQRKVLIAQLLVLNDPALVLLGQDQKQEVDECYALLVALRAEAEKDGQRHGSLPYRKLGDGVFS